MSQFKHPRKSASGFSQKSLVTYKGQNSLQSIQEDEHKLSKEEESRIDSFLDGNSPKSIDGKENKKDDIKQNEDRKVTFKKTNHSVWQKLTEKDKEDKYLSIYKDNLDLKQQYSDQEDQFKQLKTQFRVIEKEYKLIQSGQSVQKINRDNLVEIDKLRSENRLMEQKLRALQQAKKLQTQQKSHQSGFYKSKVDNRKPSGIDEDEYKLQKGKMSDMIKLVEILKQKLKDQEDQNRKLQSMLSQKVVVNTKDSTEKNIELVRLQAQYQDIVSHFKHQKDTLDEFRQKVSALNMELNRERENVGQLQVEKLSLQKQADESASWESQIGELKRQKNQLEYKLKEISSQPFFQDFKEMANNKAKQQQLQAEIQDVTNDNQVLKQKNQKLEQDLKGKQEALTLKTRELADKEREIIELKAQRDDLNSKSQPFKDMGDLDADNYMRALKIVKWKGDDPIWTHIQDIDRNRQTDKDNRSNQDVLKNEIAHLILEKGELASYLEKTQTFLDAKIELDKQKQQEQNATIEKLQLQLKQSRQETDSLKKMHNLKGFGKYQPHQIYKKDGIDYIGDNVSVFSTDDSIFEQDMGANGNYIDLYLGNVELIETDVRIKLDNSIQNLESIITFATVDFFDHDTQNTIIAEGLKTKYNFQVGYKVQLDQFLIDYIRTNCIKIEVFCGNGEEPMKLGVGEIPLLDLELKNNQQNKCFVLNGYIKLISFKEKNKNKMLDIGMIEYTLRFRYPIYEKLERIKKMKQYTVANQLMGEQLGEEDEDDFDIAKKRKLVVHVDNASGMAINSNTFVYFQFNGRDYTTEAIPGSNPKWKQKFPIDLLYDLQMRNYFKTTRLELVVFDDNVVVGDVGHQTDVVGTCQVPLMDLINLDMMELKLELVADDDKDLNRRLKEMDGIDHKQRKKDDVNSKLLYVKLFWSEEGSAVSKPKINDDLLNQAWEEEMTQKIAQAFKTRYLNLHNAFMIMDRDQDSVISFEDFYTTLTGVLGMNSAIKEELELYYSKMPKVYDWEYFQHQYKKYLEPMGKVKGLTQFDDTFFANNTYGQNQDGQPSSIQDINRLVQDNTRNLDPGKRELYQYRSLRQEIHQVLSKLMAKNNRDIQAIFKEADSDKNGFITLLEMKMFLSKKGIKSQDNQLDTFLKQLDRNNDNKINIQEFTDYILQQGNSISSDSYSKPKSQDQTQDRERATLQEYEIKKRVLDSIVAYMKKKKINFVKMHDVIDKNKDNYINKKELRDFLQNTLEMNLSLQDFDTMVNYFDPSGDDKISVQEFIEQMKMQSRSRASLAQFSKPPPKQQTVSSLVEHLAQYMKTNNLKISQTFNIIDKNKDGYLSKKEMKALFVDELGLRLNESEFEEFYDWFDDDKNEKVSVQEFVSVIQPELEKISIVKVGTKNYNKIEAEALRKKAEEATREFGNELYQNFEAFADGQGSLFVSKEDFIKTLQSVIPSTSKYKFDYEEVLGLLDNVCTITIKGKVNYRNFLGLGNIKFRDLDQNQSMMLSQKLSNELFAKIAKVLKKNNIKLKDAFQAFDSDNDGKITGKELFSSLKKMKLNYSMDEVDHLMLSIDKDLNGTINMDEFKKAIQESSLND